MGRIGRGWELTKMSFGVIRHDKELLLFPFLGMLVAALMWGLFLASVVGLLDLPFLEQLEAQAGVLFNLLYFLFYFLTAFVAVYFQAAVVGSALIRLDGGSPTVGDAFREANKHVGKLFLWALVTATVGLILRAIARQAGWIGRIVSAALGITWALASYMAIPVIVTEGLGPWSALKRSASLFRKTWGETIVGGLGLGLILFLLGLAGLLPLLVGVYLASSLEMASALLVGLGVALVYWFFVFLLWGAAWPVLAAVLYRYATTGKTALGVRESTLRNVVQA